jgi:SAM-dependent methyltransferase
VSEQKLPHLIVERNQHWDQFYSQQRSRAATTFAKYVAALHQEPALVIELGCGSGQDSIFLAEQGHTVIGIDNSALAIAQGSAAQRRAHLSGCRFVVADVTNPAELTRALPLEGTSSTPSNYRSTIVYMRFFLHSITLREENILLKTLVDQLSRGFVLAAEFRTERDRTTPKAFSDEHYRRYIRVQRLISRLEKNYGFQILCAECGRGFSVYAGEDAHLCRLIAKGPR